MAIVQSINSVYMFEAAFKEAGRGDNFTWEGLKSLFDYLDTMGDEDEPYDLDVVAICCDYRECDFMEVIEDYRLDFSECETEEEARKAVIEYLQNVTTYVGEGENGSLVFAAF